MPQNDDEKIWTAYAKGVRPIKRIKTEKPSPAFAALAAKAPSPAMRERENPTAKRGEGEGKAPFVSYADFQKPLDHKTERRLREGAVKIEARLDLHGMHQAEAHKALIGFISAQAKAGHRTLLVITGKGRGGEGVLRLKLADWLAASPVAARILALRPAPIRHGGDGAFYVMLRKPKG